MKVKGGEEAAKAFSEYVGIISRTAEDLKDYAKAIGFRDYNDKMFMHPNISSWEKDGWIVSIPDHPKRFGELMIEKSQSLCRNK